MKRKAPNDFSSVDSLTCITRIYEHRTEPSKTMSVGIFQRCYSTTEHASVCDALLYLKNDSCCTVPLETPRERHRICNLDEHRNICDFSPIGKSLISCTIIAACTIGIGFLFTFSHLFISEFKYKIHLAIAILTLLLLLLGFIFLLATMIILGSSMAYDLHQYEYNMDCRLAAGMFASIKMSKKLFLHHYIDRFNESQGYSRIDLHTKC